MIYNLFVFLLFRQSGCGISCLGIISNCMMLELIISGSIKLLVSIQENIVELIMLVQLFFLRISNSHIRVPSLRHGGGCLVFWISALSLDPKLTNNTKSRVMEVAVVTTARTKKKLAFGPSKRHPTTWIFLSCS